MIRNMRFQAAQLGLPFGERTKTYNSRLAQELGLWAESKGKGHVFHNTAFASYFAEGQNLAEREVLLTLAEKSGLPRKEAETVLDNRTFQEAVDTDWEDSQKKGITAVPTFILGSHKVVGAQPYETFVELMKEYGIIHR